MKQIPFLLSILVALTLSACAHYQVPRVTTEDVPMRPLALAGGPKKAPQGVRAPELVKAYPVGRYHDPNDPQAMHEGHTMYRVEQDATWNLNPGPDSTDLPVGPSIAVTNPASVNNPYLADLEDQVSQQQAYNTALAQQNDAMHGIIEELKASQKAETENLKKANEDLQKQLDDTKQLLQELKQQIEKPNPYSANVTREPGAGVAPLFRTASEGIQKAAFSFIPALSTPVLRSPPPSHHSP